MSARVWLALVLLVAAGARAEIYRCEEADGSIRFTGDPSRCRDPIAHAPDSGRVVVSPPAAGGEDPDRSPGDGPAVAPPVAPPLSGMALQRLLPPAGPSWQALDDPPETNRDPQLAAQGLRASAARHYTRALGPVSEVCTVEVWSFERDAQARAVQDGLDQPLWWMRSAGPVLVVAHGVRLERKVGTRHGLVPGCEALGEDAAERAAGVR